MPLFTITARHGPDGFTTQLEAPDAQSAVTRFFDEVYGPIRGEAFGASAPDLSASDLVLFAPMTGLANAWTATAGRGGRYVELACSLTVAENQAGPRIEART